jgi:hypothetical protein
MNDDVSFNNNNNNSRDNDDIEEIISIIGSSRSTDRLSGSLSGYQLQSNHQQQYKQQSDNNRLSQSGKSNHKNEQLSLTHVTLSLESSHSNSNLNKSLSKTLPHFSDWKHINVKKNQPPLCFYNVKSYNSNSFENFNSK